MIGQRKPNRLKNFDYSSFGYYYVTICTKNRECWFGEIINGEMILNEIGEIIKQCWLDIPKHFLNVFLDEYVIMPNHVHGILIINQNNVGNAYMRSLQNNWKYRTKMLLSMIIHEFKSAASRQIRQIKSSFRWQKSFYDHIIRNEESLNEIRQYIQQNPINWNSDENNSEKGGDEDGSD
jgi:REP element-mobilizing transposase RayT